MNSTNVKQAAVTCRFHGNAGCKICAQLPKKSAPILLTKLL